MLTDYHVHLRPDDLDAEAADYFTAANVERYLAAAEEAGIEELGVSEHVYRFQQALDVWDHPFWGENARDDLDAYRDFVRTTPLRLGMEMDYVPGARGPDRQPARRRGTSTTSSAPSTSSAIERSTTRDGTPGRAAAIRMPSGAAISRRSRRLRAADCSTSSPTPTWSRSGGGPARCRSATRASTTSRRSRPSARPESPSRCRPRGCESPWASSTRRPPSRRCASTRVRPSASPRTRTRPRTSATGTTRRSRRWTSGACARSPSSRGASAGSSRSAAARWRQGGLAAMSAQVGIGYDVHPFEAGRRLVLGGVEVAHERGPRWPLRRRRRSPMRSPTRSWARPAWAIWGRCFPPEEEQWRDADSIDLLTVVMGQLGGRVVNVDATLVCEEPKIGPHRAEMERLLGEALSARGERQGDDERGPGLDRAGRGDRLRRRGAGGPRLSAGSRLCRCEAGK